MKKFLTDTMGASVQMSFCFTEPNAVDNKHHKQAGFLLAQKRRNLHRVAEFLRTSHRIYLKIAVPAGGQPAFWAKFSYLIYFKRVSKKVGKA